MTAKQRRFVDEYCVDWNGARAAVRAGYAASGARVEACRLLTNANVRAAISARTAEISHRCDVSAERVLLELRRIAFCDPRRMFDGGNLKPPANIDDGTAAAISAVEVATRRIGEGEVEYINKYKFHDKLPALLALGKRTGALVPETVTPSEDGIQRVIFEYRDADAPSNKTGI